ncbi:MAG: hypothetical protein LBM77_06225 [Spirochaetaceae bacterium]|nr:hypothetical protein [Spirochaetaceae bacterium]
MMKKLVCILVSLFCLWTIYSCDQMTPVGGGLPELSGEIVISLDENKEKIISYFNEKGINSNGGQYTWEKSADAGTTWTPLPGESRSFLHTSGLVKDDKIKVRFAHPDFSGEKESNVLTIGETPSPEPTPEPEPEPEPEPVNPEKVSLSTAVATWCADMGTVTYPTTSPVELDANTQALVVAEAAGGYSFVKWVASDCSSEEECNNADAVSTNATYSFSITEDTVYYAVFSAIPPPEPDETFTLSAAVATYCDAMGTISYPGSQIELAANAATAVVAQAAGGYSFVKWVAEDCSTEEECNNAAAVSTNATYSFSITEDSVYYAVFSAIPPPEPEPEPEPVDPEKVSLLAAVATWCVDMGTVTYPSGTVELDANAQAVVVAQAYSGHSFIKWVAADCLTEADCNNAAALSSSASYSFPITTDTECYAVFSDTPSLARPETVGLSAAGEASWNWTAGDGQAAHIAGFAIELYQDLATDILRNTITVSDKDARSKDIRTEILAAAEANGAGLYYIRLKALALSGNSSVFSDSNFSAHSASQEVARMVVTFPADAWTVTAVPAYTANWIATTGASSYTVQLYRYTEKSGSAVPVSSGTTHNFTTAIGSVDGSYYFGVKALSTSGLYLPSLEAYSPPLAVGINTILSGFNTYQFPEKATIALSGAVSETPPHELSLSEGDTLTLTITGMGQSDTVRWLVDGEVKGSAASYTFNPPAEEGFHTILVQAVIGGKEYSASTRVKVVL